MQNLESCEIFQTDLLTYSRRYFMPAFYSNKAFISSDIRYSLNFLFLTLILYIVRKPIFEELIFLTFKRISSLKKQHNLLPSSLCRETPSECLVSCTESN